MTKEDDYFEEMKKDFFEEADEMLEQLESNVLSLEQDPKNQEAINEIFRAAHTIKGASATVGFSNIEKFTHSLEDSLSDLRDGTVEANEDVVDIILKSLDVLKDLIQCGRDGKPYKGKLQSHIKKIYEINKVVEGTAEKPSQKKNTKSGKKSSRKQSVSIDTKNVFQNLNFETASHISESVTEDTSAYIVSVLFDSKAEMASVGPIQGYAALKDIGEITATEPSLEELESSGTFDLVHYLVLTEAPQDVVAEQIDLPDMIKEKKLTPFDLDSLEKNIDSVEKGGGFKDEGNSQKKDEVAEEQGPEKVKKVNTSILRVDAERIDKMLNLVGELTVNKSSYAALDSSMNFNVTNLIGGIQALKEKINVLKEKAGFSEEDEESINRLYSSMNQNINGIKETSNKLRTSFQELDQITNDLRGHVMTIRMVTIGQIFQRIPRIVRDISKDAHKQVEIKMSGENTELDKSVIEDLLEPVIHIVRNAVDHGIELPEERQKNGKDPKGTLTVSASHEGNVIIVKFKDDGKGIDPDKIYLAAIKKGVITKGTQLTDREKQMLIFAAGFSTAEKISSVSGRGVGMDAVKKSIEELNGVVTIDSQVGEGTEITLKLPLTLTIVQALLVRVFTETYAIPINAIDETLKITPEEIQNIENKDVITVREEVISVLFVSHIFNLPQVQQKKYYAVIVSQEKKKVAIVVDALIGEQDIVIKALKNKLINVDGLAGAANLGDGTVCFILDINNFIENGLKMDGNADINKFRKMEALSAT